MFDSNKIYTRAEIFTELYKNDYLYNGYKIFEKNYKNNNHRTVSYDRYKVVEIVDDTSMIEDAHSTCVYNGIVFIEMVIPEQ